VRLHQRDGGGPDKAQHGEQHAQRFEAVARQKLSPR
jgi:hypothetical protein